MTRTDLLCALATVAIDLAAALILVWASDHLPWSLS